MFGMGIFEILVIAIVAIIFLGPDKLPQAMIDIVKFFKAVKKTLNDAKDTFDKELQISEMKKEALEYKNSFTGSMDNITKDIQLKEIDDIFKEYKEDPQKALGLKSPQLEPPIQASSYIEKEPKRRGRKPKNSETLQDLPIDPKPLKKRGRKPEVQVLTSQEKEPKKRGRKPKIMSQSEESLVNKSNRVTEVKKSSASGFKKKVVKKSPKDNTDV